MNPELKKRLLSLAWRTGGASIVAGLAVVLGYLPELQNAGIPAIVTALVALVIGEVTKALNKKYEFGAKILRK